MRRAIGAEQPVVQRQRIGQVGIIGRLGIEVMPAVKARAGDDHAQRPVVPVQRRMDIGRMQQHRERTGRGGGRRQPHPADHDQREQAHHHCLQQVDAPLSQAIHMGVAVVDGVDRPAPAAVQPAMRPIEPELLGDKGDEHQHRERHIMPDRGRQARQAKRVIGHENAGSGQRQPWREHEVAEPEKHADAAIGQRIARHQRPISADQRDQQRDGRRADDHLKGSQLP